MPEGVGCFFTAEALFLYSLAVSGEVVPFRKQADQRLRALLLSPRGWVTELDGPVQCRTGSGEPAFLHCRQRIPCPQGIEQGIFRNGLLLNLLRQIS